MRRLSARLTGRYSGVLERHSREEFAFGCNSREKLALKSPERIPTVDCRTQSRYISRLRSHALPMYRRSYRDFAGKFGTDSRHGLSTGQSLRDQAHLLWGLVSLQ